MGTSVSLGSTAEAQADMLISLVDHLGIQDFFVCGFSCGAAPSVAIAARNPSRVKGLILEAGVTQDFGPTWTKGLHGQLFLTEFGCLILKTLIDRAPIYTIKRLLDRESNWDAETIHREAHRIFQDPDKRNAALNIVKFCMPANQKAPGTLNDCIMVATLANEDLERVQCPTLIMHGSADGEVDYAHALNAQRRIKNSLLLKIQDACHIMCLSDNWEQVVQARHKFFHAILSGHENPFAILSAEAKIVPVFASSTSSSDSAACASTSLVDSPASPAKSPETSVDSSKKSNKHGS